jgi:hypothetical protein
MHDHETPQVAASDDPVDRLLDDAGARWRAGQPQPPPVVGAWFASITRRRRFTPAFGGHAWSFLAGAVSAVAILATLAVAAPNLLPRIGGPAAPATVDPATVDPAAGYRPTGVAHCPLTKPDPTFAPPAAPGADYQLDEGRGWYGTALLWTWLRTDGEIWSALPESEFGLTQKTFWWSRIYHMREEPQPQIFVTGSRLDRPGRFGFGPGTNASFGLGTAMLVGIDVPTEGCWNITAHYRGAELTYVVWVGPAD